MAKRSNFSCSSFSKLLAISKEMFSSNSMILRSAFLCFSEKISMMECTSSFNRIGNAKPVVKLRFLTFLALGKFSSFIIFSIQEDFLLFQTLPGRPSPFLKPDTLEAEMNSSNFEPSEAYLIGLESFMFSLSETKYKCPTSHSSVAQIICNKFFSSSSNCSSFKD